MSIPTFYYPELGPNDSLVELSSNESSHALKSRRLKNTQVINLFNGQGLLAQGIIVDVVRKQLIVKINSIKKINKAEKLITIATAIPKGDLQKTMIDMLTQLGVNQIIPLQCDYSSSKFKQNAIQKWQRITIEACKQSQRAWLPKICDLLTIPQLLELFAKDLSVQLIYADGAGCKMSEIELMSDHLVILIGPEGGFSQLEIEQFHSSELASVKLSSAILRTETAAISSVSQYFGHRS